jgi:hypothetical protein
VDPAILQAPFGPAFTATPRSGRQWPGNLPTRMATTSCAAQQAELLTHLDPASQAMLASQTGPSASRTFTTIPWRHDLTYPSHLFRLLLVRRLRLPLPLPERSCRCRRVLDPLGAQLAHEQVFCEAELARWKEQPRESAGRLVPAKQEIHATCLRR